jgi:WD40 repeat protein
MADRTQAVVPNGERLGMPETIERNSLRGSLEEWQSFLLAEAHILRGHPQLLFQQAANQPDSTAFARAASARMDAGLETRPWLQHVNKPRARSTCVMTLAGHTGRVSACAFSADGRHIVSASDDRTLRLWDAQTGADLAILAGHTKKVLACAFSPDGRRIVSASDDGTLRLWDARTGSDLAMRVPEILIALFPVILITFLPGILAA